MVEDTNNMFWENKENKGGMTPIAMLKLNFLEGIYVHKHTI